MSGVRARHWKSFLALLALCLAFAFALSPASAHERRIALTFDDVPRGAGAFLSTDERTQMLIDGLARAGVSQAAFFVNTGRIADDDGAEKRIEAYAAAGHVIANHTANHPSLSDTQLGRYLANLDAATRWLKDREGYRPWFRFPFLDEGRRDTAKRDGMRAALAQRGLINAYVTVDAYDWFYVGETERALRDGLEIDRSALRDLYIESHVQAAAFFDGLAFRAIGRSPAHVMLLHENDFAAMWIADLVAALKKDGWRVITADEAYADPLVAEAAHYDTPSAQGTLTEMLAWQNGIAAPRWYKRNDTNIAAQEFRKRVLDLPEEAKQ